MQKQLLEMEHQKDKLENDLEDKEYLSQRLKQVSTSVNDLASQHDKMKSKIKKRNGGSEAAVQSEEELMRIIGQIHTLNDYERTS